MTFLKNANLCGQKMKRTNSSRVNQATQIPSRIASESFGLPYWKNGNDSKQNKITDMTINVSVV